MFILRLVIGILIITIFLIGIPGIQAQSDEGLVAEWHFDEGSGNVVKDSSGNGNDGTIYEATWVDGKYGNALSFDGVNDQIHIPSSSNLKPSTAFTLEAWVKLNSFTNEWQTVFAKEYQWYIGINSDGHVGYWTGNGAKWVSELATPGGIIKIGNWHHIVSVYDGANKYIYIDGILFAGPQAQGYGVNDNPLQLFGRSVPVITNYWTNGIMDEVRIYNRALSLEEIKAHYEQNPTALTIIKTATPNSIKQGQKTTITLILENTGTTEIFDIEVVDTVPSDLILIEGDTYKTYDFLRSKDSREFQYVLQLNEAGTYNLDLATVVYANEMGDYFTVKSKPISIDVKSSIVPTSTYSSSKPSIGDAQSASVNLHGEKTDVALGEDVLLKLSAVNIIGNPTMHVQVIIIPPSGWSVTSSEFAKSGAGQYTTTYELESGGGKDIEVRIVPNQIGHDFQVEGRIIYYFGDDLATREDHTLNLPIKVRAETDDGEKSNADSEESKTPGFGVLAAGIGLLVTAYLVGRK